MAKYRVYIAQFSAVTVEASTLDEAEVLALEAYNTNSPEVERFKPEVEDYNILPPEAA